MTCEGCHKEFGPTAIASNEQTRRRECRKCFLKWNDTVEEVARLRMAGYDPANIVRARLFQICEELLCVYTPEEEHKQWKQRMRESNAFIHHRRVRRA